MGSYFHVGQKVTLVDDSTRHSDGKKQVISRVEARKLNAVQPVIGAVYTIRWINSNHPELLLLLSELDNSHLIGFRGCAIEPGWPADRFRPVVERETDISCFTDMLIKQHEPVQN